MKLADMKLAPAESKSESLETQESEGPSYPWGLCIYLDQFALDKLRMKIEDFTIGDEMALTAVVRVVGLSMREREGGESYQSVDLQITQMDLEEAQEITKVKTTGDKIYGDS